MWIGENEVRVTAHVLEQCVPETIMDNLQIIVPEIKMNKYSYAFCTPMKLS